jgi:hypothetical protein
MTTRRSAPPAGKSMRVPTGGVGQVRIVAFGVLTP